MRGVALSAGGGFRDGVEAGVGAGDAGFGVGERGAEGVELGGDPGGEVRRVRARWGEARLEAGDDVSPRGSGGRGRSWRW